MRWLSVGDVVYAFLITGIAVWGADVVKASELPVMWKAALVAFPVLMVVLFYPRAWSIVDAVMGNMSSLRWGLYVEFYVRRGDPYIAIFRYIYNWRKARMEIYGAPYRVIRSGSEITVAQPELRDWRSHAIDVDERGDGTRSAFYFYHPTDDRSMTGITRMYLDDERKCGGGLFSDIRPASAGAGVVPFEYYRIELNKARKRKIDGEEWRALKRILRRCYLFSQSSQFREVWAFRLACALLEGGERAALLVPEGAVPAVLAKIDELRRLPPDDAPSEEREQRIVSRLSELLQTTYSRYSGFGVAAAIVDLDGVEYYGVNVENASFPLGTCAEQGAISAMIAGGGAKISKVYLASSGMGPISPCGGCRQRLAEFAEVGCQVVMLAGGSIASREKLGDLLPSAFTLK